MMVDGPFWAALLEVAFLNIVLSADNAMVIALACRSLPRRRQVFAIALAALAATLTRMTLALGVAWILRIPFLMAASGVVLIWIAVRLRSGMDGGGPVVAAAGISEALRIVVVADAAMSLDNLVAVAAAANGALAPMVLGLAISVPLVVYAATWLVRGIVRFPAIVTIGAVWIGFVAGQVIVGDAILRPWIEAHASYLTVLAPATAASVVLAFDWLSRWNARDKPVVRVTALDEENR